LVLILFFHSQIPHIVNYRRNYRCKSYSLFGLKQNMLPPKSVP
jgi:hypothetical protein